jgi:hypothetical protein
MPDACPECGFDGRALSPADTAVALRSYPRRYRALLIPPDDDDHPTADPARRPGRSGWSAADHGAWAATAIAAVTAQLRNVLVRDRPAVEPPAIDPPRPPEATPAPAVVVDRLRAASDELAVLIDQTAGEQWTRTGVTPAGAEVTALELAHHAVHEGIHHLRATERVLAEVVGQP